MNLREEKLVNKYRAITCKLFNLKQKTEYNKSGILQYIYVSKHKMTLKVKFYL